MAYLIESVLDELTFISIISDDNREMITQSDGIYVLVGIEFIDPGF